MNKNKGNTKISIGSIIMLIVWLLVVISNWGLMVTESKVLMTAMIVQDVVLLLIVGAIFIYNIRNQNRLCFAEEEREEQATRDVLTGLSNRYAYTLLEQDYEGKALPENMILVFMDVNGLKKANDTLGHTAGDELIVGTADCIRMAFGDIGKCFRMGGDEYLVVTCCDNETFEKHMAIFDEKVANWHGEYAKTLSVSYGVVHACDYPDTDMESLLTNADNLMYRNKNKLKNLKNTVNYSIFEEDASATTDEKIKAYRYVLNTMSQNTDDFLFILDIKQDINWFFGPIDERYDLREAGSLANTTAQMLEIIHPADRAALVEDLDRVGSGKQDTHNMNYRWVDRQGHIVWISCRGKVIDVDNGEPTILLGRVSEAALRHLYNPQNGFWNRRKLLTDIRKRDMEWAGYLVLFEVENLSAIKHDYDRTYAEKVIKDFGERLENKFSALNVYQIADDRFATVLSDKNAEEVQALCTKLKEEMKNKCDIHTASMLVGADSYVDEEQLMNSVNLILSKVQ